MADQPDTVEHPPADVPTVCACGCGEPVSPGKTWIRGHHGRGRQEGDAPSAQDLTLVALSPADMLPAQTELLAWCDRKIAAVQLELADLEANLEIAMNAGLKFRGITAAVNRTAKRIVYYEKLKAAVEAGYVIVPNFPVNVFAVRVAREKAREVSATYQSSTALDAKPELLPAGEGRYVDEARFQRDESYTETIDGKTRHVSRYVATDFDAVDFPVSLVKPTVMRATEQAMALKIFDQMGLVRNDSGRDPIIVGQLLDPLGNGRRVTFFVAWWLDTASL